MLGDEFHDIFKSFSQKSCGMPFHGFVRFPAFSGKPMAKASLIYPAVPSFGHR
jgi:hypothetical protein